MLERMFGAPPRPDERAIAEEIAALFAKALDLPSVGLDAHFLFLGGDSLSVEQLIDEVGKRFGVSIETSALLDAPTPEALAALVARSLRHRPGKAQIADLSGATGAPPLVVAHGLSGSTALADLFSTEFDAKFRVMAIRGVGLEPYEEPCRSLSDFTRHHLFPLRKMIGDYPLLFVGCGPGALLAIELARAVHEQSLQRPALVLIDPRTVPGRARGDNAPDLGVGGERSRRSTELWHRSSGLALAAGLAQTALGRKLRERAFRTALADLLSGYVPKPFPCDLLIVENATAASPDIKEDWTEAAATIRTVFVPGDRRSPETMAAIEAEIADFHGALAGEPRGTAMP